MADEPTHDDFFGAARDWKRSISHRASPRPYSDVIAFGPQCCDNHTTPPGYARPLLMSRPGDRGTVEAQNDAARAVEGPELRVRRQPRELRGIGEHVGRQGLATRPGAGGPHQRTRCGVHEIDAVAGARRRMGVDETPTVERRARAEIDAGRHIPTARRVGSPALRLLRGRSHLSVPGAICGGMGGRGLRAGRRERPARCPRSARRNRGRRRDESSCSLQDGMGRLRLHILGGSAPCGPPLKSRLKGAGTAGAVPSGLTVPSGLRSAAGPAREG